jgi:hypothetical protein
MGFEETHNTRVCSETVLPRAVDVVFLIEVKFGEERKVA